MKKKKEILVIVGSLLVIILSVTLAYFTVQIIGKGKDISLDSANLKITFASGGGNISSTNIEPGWSSGASTFTVKNESNDTYKYNIIIKDLVNTFVTKGFLLYKITSTDGGYNMGDFVDVPKSTSATDTILAYSVEIAKGVTHTYTVEFKYLTSEEDQSDDMGRILSGTLYIEMGTDKPLTLAEKIIEDRTIETTPRGGAYNKVFTENTTGKLFQTTESIAGGEVKTVYYFAGAPTDNWVKFAGFYWRIIRTNHDGSIRLLYAGTSPDTTSGYIGTSSFNSSYNSPKYVGYMYGTDGSLSESRTNTNDSTIKTYIDTWYSNNLSSYSKYISTEAVYCNDRQLDSGQTWSTSSSTYFSYITYTRLDYITNGAKASPTYDCADSHDAFSGSNADAELTYPISLMTADEINIAGGLARTDAPAYYYLNSAGDSITGDVWWWSLSPIYWDRSRSYVWYVLVSDSPGYLDSGTVYNSLGVRPAISLKTCALWTSGNGAPETPYEISTTSGC
mgnify:CR=1 FL=1